MAAGRRAKMAKFDQGKEFGQRQYNGKHQHHGANKPAAVPKEVDGTSEQTGRAALSELFDLQNGQQDCWEIENQSGDGCRETPRGTQLLILDGNIDPRVTSWAASNLAWLNRRDVLHKPAAVTCFEVHVVRPPVQVVA